MKATKRTTKRKTRELTDEQCDIFQGSVLALWKVGATTKEIALECSRRLKTRISSTQVAAVLSLELHRLDDAERDCWSRWEASKAFGPGDIQAMRGLLACFDRRCQLLRLY